MDTICTITAAALVGTKFLDCWTTLKNIQGPGSEANPLARALMKRFGIQPTIWTFFLIVVTVVYGAYAYVEATGFALPQVLVFCIGGGFTALVQAATALYNFTHRHNMITRGLFRIISHFRLRQKYL